MNLLSVLLATLGDRGLPCVTGSDGEHAAARGGGIDPGGGVYASAIHGLGEPGAGDVPMDAKVDRVL